MSEMWKVAFTAPIPTVATVAAGVVLCLDTDGNTYVVCTGTAVNAALPRAITVASGTASAGVAVVASGHVRASVTGLSTGTAGPIVVSSTGTLLRYSGIITNNTVIVGWCDAAGNAIMSFKDNNVAGGDTLTAATMANGANTNFALNANDSILYITGPTGSFSLTGLTGGYDGRSILLMNGTAQTMTLTNDATSTAANRLYCYGHADSSIAAYESVQFVYSLTLTRWVQITGMSASEIVPTNLTVGGTLSVAGATTLSSTLSLGGTVTFVQGLAATTITQAQQANAAAPSNFNITPQAPGASASNATNGTAGSMVVNMAAGVNSGKSGWFTVQNNSVTLGRIGSFDGTSTTFGVLHLHSQTPSSSNYTLACSNDSSGTILNATGSINLAINNTNYFNVSAGSVSLTAALNSFQGNINAGYFTQAMADAPQTINAANSQKNIIIATGANSGVRALTISTAPNAGVIKFIRNNCTVFGITVQFSTGSATGTILPGTSAIVIADGTNAVVLMTGT